MELPGTLWIVFLILILFLTYEVLFPKLVNEGFANLVGVLDDESDKKNFFAEFVPRRGDIGLNKEEKNYIQDPRYFRGYVDVQKYGFKHDFCRLVVPETTQSSLQASSIQKVEQDYKKYGDLAKAFFACALAGTSGLSSVSYRSKDVSQGLELSRDDYMRDIFNENRYAYCRILKTSDGSYQPLCLRGLDTKFNDTNEVDPNPPQNILDLLEFYDGCVAWLRFRDDMTDYTKSLIIQKSGNISLPEDPNPSVTQGLSFNGIDQFIRVSDAPDLTLGRIIKLRSVRAFSMWVYFDSFTNNAHIFDFGDGAGNNNVFLGIIGKGDESSNNNEIRPLLCGNLQNTLPDYPSGPHPCNETTPQNLMLLKANVNEYECKLFDTVPDRLESSASKSQETKLVPTRATLLYEVWDSKQRKMRIKVPSVIPLKKWCHISISATSNDSLRPDIAIFINGTQVFVQPSGFLPQAESTTNNYLGKSNWFNSTSEYELKDEMFNGKIFDFRMYKTVMSETKIKKTLAYGMKNLAIQ